MSSKKADFNIELLFAIIAGAAILILAVYGAMKIGDTMRYQTDTEIGKQLSIFTDPLQAGFASGSFGKITFNQETRLDNICYPVDFGKNDISVSTKSRVGQEWIAAGGATSIHNKYIFSEGQGKEFYVLSKPFKFPYKVADLIFATSKSYCFVDAPNEIKDDIEGFNAPNLHIDNCSSNDLKVCFSPGCDIEVNICSSCTPIQGYVIKDGVKMYFYDSLIYGAIFSDKEIYDCNVRRLMYRTSKIAEVLYQKVDLMSARDVGSNLQPELAALSAATRNAGSADLTVLAPSIRTLDQENSMEGGKLW